MAPAGRSVWIFGDLPLRTACGPSYMVESWARELAAHGWSTRLFTPSGSWRRRGRTATSVTFRTVPHVGFHNDHHARFSSAVQMWRARRELPSAVLVTTPGRVGVLGVTLAALYRLPLVVVESTDVAGAMEHYTTARMLASSGVKAIVMAWAAKTVRSVLWQGVRRNGRRALEGPSLAALYASAVRRQADAVVLLSATSQHGVQQYGVPQHGVPQHGVPQHGVPQYGVQQHGVPQYGVQQHADDASTSVIPTGIDRLPRIPAPPELRWRPGSLRVLYVGRLSPEKSLPLLVRAVRCATDRGFDLHLILVGRGVAEQELTALAGEIGVADRVSLLGPYPRDQLGGIYASADVFAFPSLVETQAFVLNEAAHEGLPLLVSDARMNAVVAPGRSALLVAHSPQGYAEGLARLQDPALRERLGAGARHLAGQFTERGQSARLADVLSRAVTDHHRRLVPLEPVVTPSR